MRVVSIGDNCLDVYVAQDAMTVGGNALNVAVNWARYGLDVSYLGAVGTDAAGATVEAALVEAGIDVTGIERLEGNTGLTVLRLVDSDRQFLHEDFGVSGSWMPSEADLRALVGVDWVHVAGPVAAGGAGGRTGALGLPTSVDLSTANAVDDLSGIAVAFRSWTGPRDGAVRAFADAALVAGADTVVVTCGPFGSLAVNGSGVAEQEAQPIAPVDTCGAGDSFISAFVHAHVSGASLADALQSATAHASATCMHLGGFPQAQAAIPAEIRARVAAATARA